MGRNKDRPFRYFAGKLCDALKDAGLSKKEAANAAGIPYPTMLEYARGVLRPGIERERKLAAVLGKPENFFQNPAGKEHWLWDDAFF